MTSHLQTNKLNFAHAAFSIEQTSDNGYIIWIYNKSVDEHVSVKLNSEQFASFKKMIEFD